MVCNNSLSLLVINAFNTSCSKLLLFRNCSCGSDIHCVSKKATLMLHTINFNAHQLILVIFGRDVAERACYQMVICYLTSPN